MDNEDSDQTARVRRLILVFAGDHYEKGIFYLVAAHRKSPSWAKRSVHKAKFVLTR